jgi:hypothetical protein
LPISAVDTITLAFQHTRRQLIQPFRFWQWVRLALVGLLAGEMGSSGSFNFPSGGFNVPQQGGSPRHLLDSPFPNIDPALLGVLITILVVAGLVFFFLMLYISSVMRFILFDSILAKECRIRASWSRRQGPGWKYFLFHLGLCFVTMACAVVIIGIPAAIAFAAGWFKHPADHVVPLVLFGIVVFFVFLVFVIGMAVVQVLTKDFVVPQMALEGITAMEGWRRLWAMIKAEKSGYAIYIGMKIVMAIGAGIIITMVSLILILVIAVPVVAVIVAGVFGAKSAGVGWNAFTITAVVVASCVLIALLLFLMSLISVPVIVFFPAYSIYFFAPRYRPLSLALYPLPAGYLPPPEPQSAH